jgi:lipopolysaccharide/colanic/teichoic acid biosynthesis glycosyltransferase
VARGVRVLDSAARVADLMGSLEPSDTLLLIDPRSFPVEGLDAQALLAEAPEDPRWATHFVSVGGAGAGTREYADIDAEGRVRRVRRYYESVTWPFISGVAASVLPVSALLGETLEDLTLTQLRGRLAARGVPGRDVLLPGVAVDLRDEAGLLALIERHVRRTASAQAERGPVFVGAGQQVHRSARLVGPVVVHPDAVVEERALVMGPTVLGAGARVGRGAIVAQSIIAAGCSVAAGARVHHRTVFDDVPAISGASRLRAPGDELVRVAQEGPSEEMPLPRTRYMGVKRVLETTVAAGLLLLLAPLMVLIAVMVALDSKGPIFYGHEREGKGGRRFRCLKFRSMQIGAQALERELHAQSLVDGPQFKLARDPRVTRAGRVLRLTNLDEIPQLINVVRGEMGLVGPRPSPFNENQLCVPWRQGRLSVRPGITGLWQVCRHDRSEGDFHQWIEYDLLYVRHMSLLLDLRIMIATFVSMGGQKPVPISWVLPAAAASRPQTPTRSAA